MAPDPTTTLQNRHNAEEASWDFRNSVILILIMEFQWLNPIALKPVVWKDNYNGLLKAQLQQQLFSNALKG